MPLFGYVASICPGVESIACFDLEKLYRNITTYLETLGPNFNACLKSFIMHHHFSSIIKIVLSSNF